MKPQTDRERFDALPLKDRLRMGFEQYKQTLTMSTHMVDGSCYDWGPGHYSCALRHIQALEEKILQLSKKA